MKKRINFTRLFKRIYKYLMSHKNHNWCLNDYPIEFREQKVNDIPNTRYKIFPWKAEIIDWDMMNGFGNSINEAYIKLEEKFERYKSENKTLSRPGTKKKMKIVFAASSRMENIESEAVQFFKQVLDMDYTEMFVSDLSSLYDFCSTDELLSDSKIKINKLYGIQEDDIEGLIIVDIIERIHQNKIVSIHCAVASGIL